MSIPHATSEILPTRPRVCRLFCERYMCALDLGCVLYVYEPTTLPNCNSRTEDRRKPPRTSLRNDNSSGQSGKQTSRRKGCGEGGVAATWHDGLPPCRIVAHGTCAGAGVGWDDATSLGLTRGQPRLTSRPVGPSSAAPIRQLNHSSLAVILEILQPNSAETLSGSIHSLRPPIHA